MAGALGELGARRREGEENMKRIGVVDTMFARYDMGAAAPQSGQVPKISTVWSTSA